MNKTIHYFIKRGFGVLVPVIYLAFMLAGLLCAVISGLIEYEIIAELYPKSSGESIWFIFTLPFLIVFSFEIVKIFLIFFNKQSDINLDAHYLKDKSYFLGLKYVLIFISVLCTLIYSFYNLHNPEYENVLQEEKNSINVKYNKLENQIDESLNNKLELQTKQYREDNILQQTEIERQKDIYIRGTNDHRGPKYKEATRLKEQNFAKIDSLANSIESDRIKQKANLAEQKQKEIKDAEIKLSNSVSAGNKMLTATLKVINRESKFPEWQYILSIFVFSIILSIGLEYIIWSSFTVLAMNHGEIFNFSIQTTKYQNATEAEMEINKADAKKEAEDHANLARSIVETVKKKSRDIFNRDKNNL